MFDDVEYDGENILGKVLSEENIEIDNYDY